jgi:holo-[acyl-carrier protein] synthase
MGYNPIKHMLSVGIDIMDIPRISRVIHRWGDRFLRRIYTEEELKHYGHRLPSLAARFAAKEAVMKVLGIKYRWLEIEILDDPQGKPKIYLKGRLRERAKEIGLRELAVSLSHSKEAIVVASVVGIG